MNTTPRTAWLLLPLLTGCWIDTQRHPAPMLAEQGELPPGSSGQFAAGPEEVIITRLADPVFVRRPQEASSFPLYHYRNQERLNAGGWVFSGAGGRVEIALSDHERDPMLRGPALRIDVADDGEGIEADHIPRLTERFYRVDGHRSREMGGTGLGLAIVKHIVNRHRGGLRIESHPGRGSCFTVLLPAPGPAAE